MIRIRFVTGNDWISNTIRFGERDGWATHAEAVLSDGSLLGAHFNGGVEIRPAGYDKATMTREMIVELRPADMDGVVRISIESEFLAFLSAQLGKPYDATAISGLVFNRDWRQTDSWFCSELVSAGLEACGYFPKLAATDNHISPRDLLLILSGRVAIPNAA
jgi:hypothetical protein